MDYETSIRRKATDYDVNGYKILCGKTYMVYRSEYGGKVFYKVQVFKTSRDGTNTKIIAYKNVSFANKNLDCDIKDGTLIRPKKLMEDFFFSKSDKYNAVWTVTFLDWDVVKSEQEQIDDAIEVYQQAREMQITEDMLPF